MLEKRKFVISKNLILGLLLVLVLFIPVNGANARTYLFILLLSVPLVLMNSMKITVRNISWYSVYYASTDLLSLLIHFYQGSVVSAISFFAFFVCAPAIIKKSVLTRKNFEDLISFIIFVFMIYAVLGIIEAFTHFNIFDIIFQRSFEEFGANEYRSGIYRGHGFLTVSINNAMLMNMVWAIAAYKLCNAKSNKTFWFISWLIIGLDVVLIMSRMVIAIAVISQLLIFRKNGIKWFSKRLLIIICAFLICLYFIGEEQFDALWKTVAGLFTPIIDEIFGTSFSASVNSTFQGSGQRFELWSWVYNDVKNNLLFGNGYTEKFFHMYNNVSSSGYAYSVVKSSIEVHWLFVLFQKGLFGLSGFIVYQIGCVKKVFKRNVKIYEQRVTFHYVAKVITIVYFISLFTCSGFEDLNFFYIVMALHSAYLAVCGNGTLRKNNLAQGDTL